MEFEEVIVDRDRLRELVGAPRGYAAVKSITYIDELFRKFIAASPFVIVATRGADGLLDVSPKGDPAGFVEVLDEKTLALPDRPGNQRLDSFENLLNYPEISLIFIIPGNNETLRVAGRARIVRDHRLQIRQAVRGKFPLLCFVIDVEEAFMHCPKCMVRSNLWKSEYWPSLTDVPTLVQSVKRHANPSESVEELQRREDLLTIQRLY